VTFFQSYHGRKANPINLCVGIDPTPDTMLAWGLDDTPSGILEFGRTMLEAVSGIVSVVKPQVAYFERFGSDGYHALSMIIAEAQERRLLVIADAKRGDIGSTTDAYAQAWLGANAPLRVDAITVNPYLGLGSLKPLLRHAASSGAYVFVVVRSSNPEGSSIQLQGNPPVWKRLIGEIAAWSDKNGRETVGAVIGATVIAELDYALRHLPDALFLAPGIGKQGASISDLSDISAGLDRVIASSSRGIAAHGPDVEALKDGILRARGG